MLTMLGWSSRAASRASLRNISTNCRSRERCGRIRLRQTSFSKPAAPAWRARYTSAIPPEAMRRTSLYLPIGVVIAHGDATARLYLLPEFHGARECRKNRAWEPDSAVSRSVLREVAQRVLHALQLSGERGGVRGMCAVSLPHRLKLSPRALHELRRGGDVRLGVIPREIRPQAVQLRDLSAGEPRERARAVHQGRGRATVTLLSGVPRPVAEQVEQPAIEGVLFVELGIGGRFLPGRNRNGTVRLVRRRQRRRAGREEASSLDHQQASLGGDAEAVLVALGGEPSDGRKQRQDEEPEHEPLECSSPSCRLLSHGAVRR